MNYILLISRDESLEMSLRVLLKDDFIMEHAGADKAPAIIAERRPSLVILDSNLNCANSVDFLSELLENEPELIVLKLVNSFNRQGRAALEGGAFDVIEKPFDTEYLVHRIKKGLEVDRLIREKKVCQRSSPSAGIQETVSATPKENFFETLFSSLGDNFPDVEKISAKFLKMLRRHYFFNNMAIFLIDKGTYPLFVSYGIEDKLFQGLKLNSGHSIVRWFLSQKRILNILSDEEIDFQTRSFMELINCDTGMPLRTMDGRLKGFLLLGCKATGKPPSLSEVSFINIVADYLTTIIDSAMLYKEGMVQKDYQQAIFQNIPAGVIGVDGEGLLTIINSYAERIFNLKAEEVTGKPIETAGSKIAHVIRRTLTGEIVFMREEIEYKPAGINIGISTSCLKSPKGDTQGVVAIFQDLTYIKEVEAKEREVERSRYWADMASRLSHELKNPLVAIKTFAQMLPEKYNEEEFRTTFSKLVQQEIGRINDIVERINKLADNMELNSYSINLSELLKEQSDALGKRGMEVRLESDGNILLVCDPVKIKEAFEYIHDFIYEDAGASGRVCCKLIKNSENIYIVIEENGTNIAFEHGEDLFVPFNPQIKSTVSIGMILAKKIMEAHGGIFTVEAVPAGKKLVLTFPSDSSDKGGNGSEVICKKRIGGLD